MNENPVKVRRLLVLESKPVPYRERIYQLMEENKEWCVTFFFATTSVPGRAYEILKLKPYYHFLPKSLIGRLRLLLTEVNPNNVDLLLSFGHWPPALLFAGLIAIFRKVPIVYWADTNNIKEQQRRILWRVLKRLVLKSYLKRVNALLSPGSVTTDFYCDTLGESKSTFWFPYVNDNTRIAAHAEEARIKRDRLLHTMGIGIEQAIVLYVGRLVRKKGVDVLLEAFAHLTENLPHCSLLLVGDGPERKALQLQVVKLGLTESVKFLGSVPSDGLSQYYGLADIFVLPSRDEPWGLVVNEAMACGLPVIVSENVGASRDLIVHGHNGYIVPDENIVLLAEFLELLIRDCALRNKMGERSRAMIQRWNYEEAYKSLCRALHFALRSERGLACT